MGQLATLSANSDAIDEYQAPSKRKPVVAISALREERDRLAEEVRQLRAAVQIYAEVVRKMSMTA